MSYTITGLTVGALLAFASLQWGFGGFLLTSLFMAIGAILGRWASGKLDLIALVKTVIGKQTTSD